MFVEAHQTMFHAKYQSSGSYSLKEVGDEIRFNIMSMYAKQSGEWKCN